MVQHHIDFRIAFVSYMGAEVAETDHIDIVLPGGFKNPGHQITMIFIIGIFIQKSNRKSFLIRLAFQSNHLLGSIGRALRVDA